MATQKLKKIWRRSIVKIRDHFEGIRWAIIAVSILVNTVGIVLSLLMAYGFLKATLTIIILAAVLNGVGISGLTVASIWKKKEPDLTSFIKVDKEVRKLARKIKKSGFEPDLILGIINQQERTVGGAIVGALLAAYLEKPEKFRPILYRRKSSIDKKLKNDLNNKNVLLVDDQSKTGKTVRTLYGKLKKIAKDVRIAIIVIKSESWWNNKCIWEEKDKQNKNKNKHFYSFYKVEIEVYWPWEV